MTCCQCQGIEQMFDDRMARRQLRHYRRKGPAKATRRLLEAIAAGGIGGRTFIDIGGGVGAIQHDLMGRGAASGTSADASPAYLAAARTEAEARGYANRMRYVDGDFVEQAGELEAADIVTLDRVVCCYPGRARTARIPAGNRLTTYRAARSAFPAVVMDPAGPRRDSGKSGPEWRDSRARASSLNTAVWPRVCRAPPEPPTRASRARGRGRRPPTSSRRTARSSPGSRPPPKGRRLPALLCLTTQAIHHRMRLQLSPTHRNW